MVSAESIGRRRRQRIWKTRGALTSHMAPRAPGYCAKLMATMSTTVLIVWRFNLFRVSPSRSKMCRCSVRAFESASAAPAAAVASVARALVADVRACNTSKISMSCARFLRMRSRVGTSRWSASESSVLTRSA